MTRVLNHLVICFAIMFVAPCGVTAAVENATVGMQEKFFHGAANTLTFVVELPMQLYKGYVNGISFLDDMPAASHTGGLI